MKYLPIASDESIDLGLFEVGKPRREVVSQRYVEHLSKIRVLYCEHDFHGHIELRKVFVQNFEQSAHNLDLPAMHGVTRLAGAAVTNVS